MGKKSEYKIGFTGLPDGTHVFNYEIGKSFFEHLDYSEIKDARLKVELVLNKKPTLMTADFSINGEVMIMCDKCTDDFFLPVEGTGSLVYKFGETDMDDENVQTIYPNETEIDVSQPIYEFTALLLPPRRIHPEGQCNQDMLDDMDQYLMIEAPEKQDNGPDPAGEGESDPRWAALKKLKK